MIARELLSKRGLSLRTSLTGEEALQFMQDANIHHLPIVNNEQLLGLISEEDILGHDPKEPIGSYKLSILRPYVEENDHLFEVLQLMAQYELSLVPVVSAGNQEFLGCVLQEDLMRYFASSFSFAEPGSLIVLEVSPRDYVLSDIARIIESENAKVLSSFITTKPEENLLYITLKISAQDLRYIIASLERYDYHVTASYTEENFQDTLKERYDQLMAYLRV